jgi:hypothetical protein
LDSSAKTLFLAWCKNNTLFDRHEILISGGAPYRCLLMLALLFLSLFFMPIFLFAQEADDLLPVKIDGKWGFINVKGEISISPQYSSALRFSEKLSAVYLNTPGNKCGYVNKKGEFVIEPKFDYCDSFNEGFAVINLESKYGYIDKYGRYLIAPRWQKAWGFSNGLARIVGGDLDKARYGFVNRAGKVVIAPQYAYLDDFNEGLALAAVDTKNELKIGFIDTKGKWVIKPEYGSATSFSEGLAAVTKDGKSYLFEGSLSFDTEGKDFNVFYINKSGEPAFDKTFSQGGKFSEGLAPVEIRGKWFYINNKGNVIIETKFSSKVEIGTFFEGLAPVNFSNGAKFIDKTGDVILKTEFDWADNFSNGISRVKKISKDGSVNVGYIDLKGNIIWRPSK